jgi:signal transduction histidine kinase
MSGGTSTRLGPHRKSDGQVDGVVITFIDMTAIHRLNDALSHRTAELEASQEQLLRQDRNKEAFLAVLSHELRNPLATIQNSVELISATDQPPKGAIDILKRQTQHVARLVNDLLDVARINRGTLELRRELNLLSVCWQRSIRCGTGRMQRGWRWKSNSPKVPSMSTPIRGGFRRSSTTC